MAAGHADPALAGGETMIVIGIGAKSTATAAEIIAAVHDCCGRSGVDVSEVAVFAGLQRPSTLAALQLAAIHFKARVKAFEATVLQNESARCITHSDRSLATTGIPSVAEAAALAAAGSEGMLILPRVAFATVTVAVAVGPEVPQR